MTFNSVHFGLRGCEEHRQMTWGDVQLHIEGDGTEYLECSERQTKIRTGAEPRSVRAVKPKAFAAPNHLKEIQLLFTRFIPKSDLTR